MEIKLQSIRVRDLVAGYENDADKGVWGYGGRLDIRPPYQREFRYDLKQKQAVVNTILKGFPLNIMYWSVVGDDKFEMIDGQQRTLSFGEFRYHDSFENDGMLLAELGHYQSEKFTIDLLASVLAAACPETDSIKTSLTTNPICYDA